MAFQIQQEAVFVHKLQPREEGDRYFQRMLLPQFESAEDFRALTIAQLLTFFG